MTNDYEKMFHVKPKRDYDNYLNTDNTRVDYDKRLYVRVM